MPNTYPIKQIGLRIHQEPCLSYAVREIPEGATQTYPAPAPVVLTAGLIVQAADPATAIFGFAVEAGANTTGGVTRVVPAVAGLSFFSNFLTAAGATNTLAAADLGITRDLHTSDVLPPTPLTAVWHAADATAADSIRIIAFESDIILNNLEGTGTPVATDVDARIECVVLNSINSYY